METKVYIGKTLFSSETGKVMNRRLLEQDLIKFVKEVSGTEEFTYIKEKSGKPKILKPEGWYFNITHKKEIGFFVLTNVPIGVDIEEISKKRNYIDIAKEFYTTSEYNFILKTEPYYFYHIWSRKEAYLKQRGESVWNMANVPELISNSANIKTWELCIKNKKYSLSVCIEEGKKVQIQNKNTIDYKSIIF